MSSPDKPAEQILRTKLHRPELTSELVDRARLIELMDRVDRATLTLVSAPAGYGKSVACSYWAASRQDPVAWVSLDASDADLRDFLEYVVAAFRGIIPDTLTDTGNLLASRALPPPPVVATFLLNDLDALPTSCALVLDDYHRIEPASPVHELVARLLERPSARVRFVILTRRDPPLALSQLRADGQINEVRLQDLRFTRSETASFITGTTGVEVSESGLGHLKEKVEGWAVGLRLVSLALKRAANPDDIISGMGQGIPNARDYLLQEVLETLTPALRECLLFSSLLDRFNEAAVQALCEPAEPSSGSRVDAKAFMAELRQANLFAISLDARGEWYRYHHLFQELLQRELLRRHGPEYVAALHRRAGEWFESQQLVEEALHHILASSDFDRAADLIERNRRQALSEDRWYVLDRWLGRLPAEVVESHAELLMARAWVLLHEFYFESVFLTLERIESILDAGEDSESLRGEVAFCRGYILFFMGQGAPSRELMDFARERLPASFYEGRAQVEVIYALSSQMVGERGESYRRLDDLLSNYDLPENLAKTRLLVTYVMSYLIAGDLDDSESANRALRKVAVEGNYAYAEAWTDYLQGLIHLQRCEMDQAAEYLGRSSSKRFIHFKRAAVDSIAALALTFQIQGQSEEADSSLAVLREFATSLADPSLWPLVDSAAARLAIMQGRLADAVQWAGVDQPPVEGAMLWWLDVPSVTQARVLVAEGSSASLEAAEAQLRARVEMNEEHHNIYHLVEVLVLHALALHGMGEAQAARGALDRALKLARPGGLLFPFVEPGQAMVDLLEAVPIPEDHAPFVGRVLAFHAGSRNGSGGARASGRQPAAQVAPDAEPALDELTNREIDVVELLADRLQDKEIADRLCISPHTVRDHLKHIYDKLDVHSRRRAVQRAAELGLLDGRSG